MEIPLIEHLKYVRSMSGKVLNRINKGKDLTEEHEVYLNKEFLSFKKFFEEE